MEKVCSKCGEEKDIVIKTTLCEDCVRERKKIYTSTYFNKHKDELLSKSRDYYQNNKEKHKISVENWINNNKEHRLEKERIRKRKDRKLRPYVHAWRDSLKSALDRLGRKKEGHTIDLLGYSPIQLKKHIENRFKEGMSWDNYGEWEIDHIREICTFDKNTPINIVNSLDNLQPLWSNENLEKWFELKRKLKDGIQSRTELTEEI